MWTYPLRTTLQMLQTSVLCMFSHDVKNIQYVHLKYWTLPCDFSDIHHSNGDWDPAQCCHAPAPQSSAFPGGHHGLLLPPGP